MSRTSKTGRTGRADRASRIDDLMERASTALAATRYFEAERMIVKALGMAREARDFERAARIALPLQEARRQRVQLALDAGAVHILDDEPVTEEMAIEAGCYLVRPPMVGADARRLRLAAMQRELPVLVVCREPTTQLGLVPIVAITPGLTVRTKVDPPDDPEHPDQAWLTHAMEALGDAAIESLDPTLEPSRKVDAVLDRLDAIPEHEKLHQSLEAACVEAAKAAVAKGRKQASLRMGT